MRGSWKKLTDANSVNSTMGASDAYGNYTSAPGDYSVNDINFTTSSLSDLSNVNDTAPSDGVILNGTIQTMNGCHQTIMEA